MVTDAFNLALGRWKQKHLCESETSLIYMASSRSSGCDPDSKQTSKPIDLGIILVCCFHYYNKEELWVYFNHSFFSEFSS